MPLATCIKIVKTEKVAIHIDCFINVFTATPLLLGNNDIALCTYVYKVVFIFSYDKYGSHYIGVSADLD